MNEKRNLIIKSIDLFMRYIPHYKSQISWRRKGLGDIAIQVKCQTHNYFVQFIIYPVFFRKTNKRIVEVLAHECGHILISDMEGELEHKYKKIVEEAATSVGNLFLHKGEEVIL